jgi:hypothetical protein
MALERLSEDRVEKALQYLAETDYEMASWKSMVLRTEMKAKSTEAMVYAALKGEGSVEDRKMQVRLNPEVQKAWDEHFDCVSKSENIKNQRERQVLIIELYRSVLSARKQGMTI